MRVSLWGKCLGISDAFRFDMIHDQSVGWEVYLSIPDLQAYFVLNKRYSGSFTWLLWHLPI